ncbi:hypothetical protein ACFLZW_06575 [Chloroflexota bacterium]
MEEIIFKYPRGRQALMIFGLVLFVFLSAFLLFESNEMWPYFAAIIGLGAIVTTWQALRSMVTFTVDAQGIRKRWLWGAEVGINWMNVTQVRPNRLNHGLTLSDHMGMEAVSLDPNVDAYPALLDYIREARPGLWQERERDVFNLQNWLSLVSSLLVAAAMLLFFVFMLGDDPWFFMIFFVIILVVPLLMIVLRPLQVWIDGLDLHIRYLWGVKQFSVSQLQAIEMQIVQGSRGRKNTYLILFLKDGQTIRLPGDGRKSSIAYIVLVSWWRRNALAGEAS